MVLSYAHSQRFPHRQPDPRETEPENVRTDLLIGNAQNPPEQQWPGNPVPLPWVTLLKPQLL